MASVRGHDFSGHIMRQVERSLHNQYQRNYFDMVERARLALGTTPYVLNHVQRVIDSIGATAGDRVLEVGAGPGNFTFPLIEQGVSVVANDLSPVLLARLSEASGGEVATLACDIVMIGEHTSERFDHAVGFFVLHHLLDFDAVFRALAGTLRPGARVSFCEPVAWNPLYYLQILCTPSMHFAGEPSITKMRPGVILPAMRRAGFIEAQSERYGYFPPFAKNRPAGDRIEQLLDGLGWVPFPNAFQLFTARLPC